MKPSLRLILIRHAVTHWNADGRIQGRTDVPLSPAGRAAAQTWKLPLPWSDYPVVASPLARTLETAQLISPGGVTTAPALIEMHWGDFEGARLVDLRREHGSELTENESRGLDFRPPGGESPREVASRALAWARAYEGQHVIGVTHKGVIRAVMAHALDWTMTGRPPVKLAWDCAHVFDVTAEAIAAWRLNVPLDGAAQISRR